jgi:hypothetical protein
MQMAAVTKYSTTHSSPLHFMEVSGQLHLPPTLHLGKQPKAVLDVLENSFLKIKHSTANKLY